jgi:opacity protein-like surface antigen
MRRLIIATGLLFTATVASAQTSSGPIVSGTVGAVAIDSTTDFAFSVAAGYRFNRAFGLGIELTSVPDMSSEYRYPFRVLPISPINYRAPDGEVTTFTTNVRLEIPTTSARIIPFVVAGGGFAEVKQGYDLYILAATATFEITSTPVGATIPTIYPPYPYVQSSMNLALTFGGGVGLLAGEHFSIDVDLRYLRLSGQQDRNVGRFGLGASYRF